VDIGIKPYHFVLELYTESTLEYTPKGVHVPKDFFDNRFGDVSEKIYTIMYSASVSIRYPLIPKLGESELIQTTYDSDDDRYDCFGTSVIYYDISESKQFNSINDVVKFIESYPLEKAKRREFAFNEQIKTMITSGADELSVEKYTKKYHDMIRLDNNKLPYY
jgi:hypothetical protein